MGRHDAVGGDVLTQLLEAMAFRGRAVIVGAYDLRPFQASALTVPMGLQEIRSYVYRYFLEPPRAADIEYLCGVLDELADPSTVVPIAGLHRLEDFRDAPVQTAVRPEAGKRVLIMDRPASLHHQTKVENDTIPLCDGVARRHAGAIPPRHILRAPDSPA